MKQVILALVLAAAASGQSIIIDRDARHAPSDSRQALDAKLVGKCAVSLLPVGGMPRGLEGSDRMVSQGAVVIGGDPMTTGTGEVLFFPGDPPEINTTWNRQVRGNHYRPLRYAMEAITPSKRVVVKVPFLKGALKKYERESELSALYMSGTDYADFVESNPKIARSCGIK